jgi:hypothetical protein
MRKCAARRRPRHRVLPAVPRNHHRRIPGHRGRHEDRGLAHSAATMHQAVAMASSSPPGRAIPACWTASSVRPTTSRRGTRRPDLPARRSPWPSAGPAGVASSATSPCVSLRRSREPHTLSLLFTDMNYHGYGSEWRTSARGWRLWATWSSSSGYFPTRLGVLLIIGCAAYFAVQVTTFSIPTALRRRPHPRHRHRWPPGDPVRGMAAGQGRTCPDPDEPGSHAGPGHLTSSCVARAGLRGRVTSHAKWNPARTVPGVSGRPGRADRARPNLTPRVPRRIGLLSHVP